MRSTDPRKAARPAREVTWRQLVLSEAARDRGELQGQTRDHLGGRRQNIERLLQRAERAADEPGQLRQWWNGSRQDLAWLSLHEAEAEIDLVLTRWELEAHARDLLVKSRGLLAPDDKRVKVVEDLLGPPAARPTPDEAAAVAVAHLARAVWQTSDERYAQSRSFRNRLIRLSLISLVALGLLLTAFAVNAIPLQVKGVTAPSYLEIALLVSLFGAVGALISAVPPLARAQGTWNPFSLPSYQMLVKIALGPVFAIIGTLLLQAGLIPNVAFPMALADLLLWALAFGAAQQALTRVVDGRVAGLLAADGPDRRRTSSGQPAHT